jgi:CRP/FNR family cyclic AMP-dependent transcriptional regulator
MWGRSALRIGPGQGQSGSVHQLEILTATIDATWFGAGLSPGSRARLAGIGRDYAAPGGAHLLRKGDETREFSILVHGRAALGADVRTHGSGAAMIIEPGDVFGWTALLPPFRATTSVVALEPVRVLAFDAARLRAAVRSDAELAAGVYEQVLEAVARRLLATQRQLMDLSGTEAIDSSPY